jgi:hypothetical protein
MPNVQLSNIPWRKEGIRYANNEAYFDCIEELDAIIDKNGSTITCEIQGYVINALDDMIRSQNLVSLFFFKFLMSD